MVLPSQEKPTDSTAAPAASAVPIIDPQDKRLRKISRRSSFVDSRLREANVAAKEAADAAVTAMLGNDTQDLNTSDDGSTISHELAMERGIARGFHERNESERNAQIEEHGTLTSIPEMLAGPTQAEQRPKKSFWKNINPLRNSRKRTGSWAKKRRLSSMFSGSDDGSPKDITREAWMCGCCGKVFFSFEVADLHEERCLYDRIEKLGFQQDEKPTFIEAENDKDDTLPATPQLKPLRLTTSIASTTRNISDFDVKPSDCRASGKSDSNMEQSREALSSILRPSSHLRHDLEQSLPNTQFVTSSGPTKFDRTDNTSTPPLDVAHVTKLRRNSGTFSDPGLPLSPTTMNAVNATLEVKKEKTLMRRKRKIARMPASNNADLLLALTMRENISMTDEALVNAVERASAQVLNKVENNAENALRFLSIDKVFYDTMMERHQLRNSKAERFRSEGQGILSKVQNKFVDAYQLIKEGDHDAGPKDQYNRKGHGNEGTQDIIHDDNTLYVNVVVKHSVTVVNNELERMAKQRWADVRLLSEEERGKINKFERFRAMAHGNLVKLAGMALASDFTPRKVAVQLSNDLYRLMVPQLRRRGVTIETEIEYRVGPYFILAVNVKGIDWQKLIKFTHRDVLRRRNDWKQEQSRREELRADPGASNGFEDEKTEADTIEATSVVVQFLNISRMMYKLTGTEMVALFLSSLYHVHWTISLPLCVFFYNILLRTAMQRYVLSTVTDEIFSYVEEKGMEMEIGVKEARYQASFMLAALREMREDSREKKKKLQEVESADKGDIIGPLLGALIKADKNPAPPPPDGFELPENLEFVGLEIDLPVGFRRLRWAFLDKDSQFLKDGIFREAKYDNITIGDWNKYNDIIGSDTLPTDVTEKDIIGAEKQTSYLMPKSVFVSANMATETMIITSYNDYCFCIKKRCLTPDVPYGSTFVAWTQLVFINTGNNTTRLTCSVEAEFPNGPPMVGRQIKSGMRSGVGDLFVLVGETIVKYSDEYP